MTSPRASRRGGVARASRLLIAVPAVILLAGCITVVQEPSGAPNGAPEESEASASGSVREWCEFVSDAREQRFDDCDELIVEGTDYDIEVGNVESLVLRGDRIEVDAASIGSLSISGQENDIDVDGDLGSLDLNGDRNEVDVDGEIGSVTIAGNDNGVQGEGGVGSIDDSGDRNRVGP